MKDYKLGDYTLSEIKEICKQNKDTLNLCSVDCPFRCGYCGTYFGIYEEPNTWQLDTDWRLDADKNGGLHA